MSVRPTPGVPKLHVGSEDRIISQSKELLERDRLDALEGKGRRSRILQEVEETETALKALQSTLYDPQKSRWQRKQQESSELASQLTSHKSPRTTYQIRSANLTGYPVTLHDRSSDFHEGAQSHLSRESQLKIARIRGDVVEIEAEDTSGIWTARRNDESFTLDKRPNTDLINLPPTERRELAPYISVIYDQIFLDQGKDFESLQVHEEVNKENRSAGFERAAPKESTSSTHVGERDYGGFWVDFKSVDLNAPDTRRGRPSEGAKTYGSMDEDGIVQLRDDFMARSKDRLRTVAAGLATLLILYVLWNVYQHYDEIQAFVKAVYAGREQ